MGKIAAHMSKRNNKVYHSYSKALQKVREEVKEQNARDMPRKTRPTAEENGTSLQSNGLRGEVATKVVTDFNRLVEVLEE